MSGKKFILLTAALFAATLWGCGSNRDSGSDVQLDSDSAASVQTVGMESCKQCHSTYFEAWLEGRHANIETDETHNGSPSPGFHTADSGCGACHNKLDEAQNMPAIAGVSMRDVVTCESCHGGGSAHRGLGPIPFPQPGVEQCAQCHAEKDADGNTIALRSRSGHSPVATTAVTDHLETGHQTARFYDRQTCVRCHSDEGARLYRHLNTRSAITKTTANGALPIADASPIQCRTCHDVHAVGGAKLLMPATVENDVVVASAQYNTCNNCHGGDSNIDGLVYHEGHFGSDPLNLLDRQISDTHYDDPATAQLLEGYVLRKNADSACTDCHSAHSMGLEINRQWGRSGHAGRLLDVKAAAGAIDGTTDLDPAAVMAATVGSETADGWVHYPWETTARAGCQRCHTSTGAANFMKAPATYDPANNDFSHLADWATTGDSPQAELLYCWGCHSTAATGALNTGSADVALLTTGGTAVTFDGEAVVIPNQGGSNVCLSCHGGAGNMDSAKSSRFVGHHAQAGGTIFAEIVHMGLEYPDQEYTYAYFSEHGHGTIESPCVSCHMGEGANHTFAILETDLEGTVTGFPNKSFCDSCHTPGGAYEVTADMLHEEKEGYVETGALLGQLLANDAGYTNYLGVAVGSSNYNTVADGAYFAFQNQKLPAEEPGGFAHNRYYVKRLLFDSIDFMMDGELNGTITLTAGMMTDYPEAAHWLRADETTGVAVRPGTPAPAGL